MLPSMLILIIYIFCYPFQSTMPPLTCLLKPQSPFEDSAGEVFAVALASFGAFFAFAAVSLEVEVVGRAVVELGDPSLTCWQRIKIRLQYLISLAYVCAVFLCSLSDEFSEEAKREGEVHAFAQIVSLLLYQILSAWLVRMSSWI